MKRMIIICLLVMLTGSIVAQTKPNIILFIVDDMGWQDCSVPFYKETTELNKHFHTPNMERLAKQGMKFTNAYATPVCSPSRISLMTGMNAARHRVTNWTLRKDQTVDHNDSLLQSPAWNINGMSPVEGIPHTVHATALPALLQQSGYHTIHVGKAHFGAMETPAADPKAIGFNVNIAGHAAGGPGSYLASKNFGNQFQKHTLPWGIPGLEAYHGTETDLSEALTLEAMKAMDEPVQSKTPFFLYMSHYAVHVPLEKDKRFYQKYLDAGLDSSEAKYASMVEGMDKSLGDIMNYLETKNIADNTIIMFISDNGGFSMSPRGGKAFTHNLPLKSGKGSVYEGGIREPMLVKWSGVVKPASVTNEPVIIEDFFPTILRMAGVKNYKTIQQVDGKDFTGLLKQQAQKNKERSLIWHVPNKWTTNDGPGINYHSAIRLGNWKLVYNMKTGAKELYNLQTDIGEERNVAAVNVGKVKQLSLLLSQQLRNRNALMPIVKETGKTVLLPDGKAL
jgi:arylsulfatase A-like enzyme